MFEALGSRWVNADLVSQLPHSAFEKLNAMENRYRYNNPVQWGVDVFRDGHPN